MEAHKDIVIAPAPKATRGFCSSIDVSDTFVLSFNGNSVVVRPHSAPNQSLILNHVSDVMAARLSHDGQLLASIDSKGTLVISQLIPDRIIEVYKYNGVFPNAKYIDWSADKKKICVVGEGKNRFAKVISIDTGIEVGQIGSASTTLNSCSFRPERPYKLVLGGDQFDLKGFDGPPYKYIKSNKAHSSFVNHVKYSPKGGLIISGGADRRLVLYDGKSFDKVAEKQEAHQGGIYGVDWIDEEHFVTVSSDKVIKIWNTKFEENAIIEAASAEDMKNPKKYSSFLVAVKVHKDNIYAANIDGDILVYKNPLKSDASLVKKISGNRSKIVSIEHFSQNILILLDSGGRVLSFDISNQELSVCASQIDMNGIAGGFVHGQRLFVLTNNGAVWVFEGSEPKNFKFIKMHDGIQFRHISQGTKDNQLVGNTNNKLFIYDIQAEKVLNEITINEDISELKSNQHFILAGTVKGKVHIFNSELKKIEEVTLNTFKISTLNMFATPQSNIFRCLMGDACGKMSMVEISEQGVKAVKETMGGHSSVITGAVSGSKKLYTFSMDGKVCIWNGDSLMREDDIKNPVNGGILCGSMIGDYLVVSGNDMVTKMIRKGK